MIKRLAKALLLASVFIISFVTYITWPAILNVLKPSEPIPQFTVPATILKTGGYPDTAKGVLEEYLRLDAEGGYLSDEGLQYLGTLSPTNSGMQNQMLYIGVIKDYRIKYLKTTPDMVTAEVAYNLLGDLEHLAWFLPGKFNLKKEKERHRVEIVRRDGKWKLNTELYSYISVPTARKYIKMAASDESAPRFIVEGADKLIGEIESAAK